MMAVARAADRVPTEAAAVMPPVRVPFSVFEELLNLADRPETPSTIHTEYRFEGVIDEDRFRDAVAAAVAVHPMARARRVAPRVWLRPPQWEIGAFDMSSVVRSVSCQDEAALAPIRDAFYSQLIDLATAPAFRALIVRRPGGDSLLLSLNHTITDGVGTLRFVHSIARAYTTRPDPVPPIDPLQARALNVQFGRETSPQTLKAGRPKNPWRTPSFVTPESVPGERGYRFLHLTLSSDERRRLSLKHYGADATINDLLQGALNLTIAGWNRAHDQPANNIGVLMPVNFRPLDWYGEIVGNLTLGGRVITTPAERATPELLMAAVMRRTQWLKNRGGGLPLFFRLPSWLYNLIPVVLSGLSRVLGDRGFSGVLSYYGRVDGFLPDFGAEAGAITEAWGSPPVYMPTAIAIGSGTLGGRLLITVRCCRAAFTGTAARRFADLLVANLIDDGQASSSRERRRRLACVSALSRLVLVVTCNRASPSRAASRLPATMCASPPSRAMNRSSAGMGWTSRWYTATCVGRFGRIPCVNCWREKERRLWPVCR